MARIGECVGEGADESDVRTGEYGIVSEKSEDKVFFIKGTPKLLRIPNH